MVSGPHFRQISIVTPEPSKRMTSRWNQDENCLNEMTVMSKGIKTGETCLGDETECPEQQLQKI